MEENIVLTRETIKRLLNDIKEIIKNPLTPHGIHYVHDDTNMLKGKVLIIGPSDTPYENGFYLFEIDYPPNYPYSPPTLKYCTNDGKTRFNPNLYKCGKVCLSILNTWKGEQWTSCQSISTVLLTLCTILNENPLLNEPGILATNENCDKYNEIIKYRNIEFAMLELLTNENYNHNFSVFMPIMEEKFIQNFESTIKTVDKGIENEKKGNYIIISIYYMDAITNYKKLKTQLIKYYKFIQNKNIV
jgi:ubiquitin-conjugating enzyme E2 Z